MMNQKDDSFEPPRQEYSGAERRRYNHEEAVQEVKKELSDLKARVDDIYYILHKFEGVSIVIKVIFFAVAPLFGLVLYIRDHLK